MLPRRVWEVVLALQDALSKVFISGCHERQAAADHEVADDATRPQIAGARVSLLEHLRRGVAWGANHLMEDAAGAEEGGGLEVRDPRELRVARHQQQVLGLEVAVGHPAL